jgi:hypothetical protein
VALVEQYPDLQPLLDQLDDNLDHWKSQEQTVSPRLTPEKPPKGSTV